MIARSRRLRRRRRLDDASTPPAKDAVGERVLAVGIDHPVVVLAPWARLVAQHLDEALVQRQIMAYRIAPAAVGAAEELESLHKVVVDLRQRQTLVRRVADRHRDEGDVGERRLRSALVARRRLSCRRRRSRCRGRRRRRRPSKAVRRVV